MVCLEPQYNRQANSCSRDDGLHVRGNEGLDMTKAAPDLQLDEAPTARSMPATSPSRRMRGHARIAMLRSAEAEQVKDLLMVRYEDMRSDTAAVLERIVCFAGEEPAAKDVEAAVQFA